MPDLPTFDYATAFSRNLGWLTAQEQARLRGKRVAIAGLGGVGGSHLLTLARLGIGAFTLAEFDRFELANFNRQVGATMSSLGEPKLDVMVAMAREINPELDIRVFPEGVTRENISDFLAASDIFVDGLDFFAFEARKITFGACSKAAIPAVTAAPLGMGAALLTFLPGGMTFEEYFRLNDAPEAELALRFLIGLSPFMLQRTYLVEPSSVNMDAHRGPSTAIACELCAGMVASEVLKLLLKRGKVWSVPWVTHFDAYRNRLARSWRPWGNRNPVQRLALAIGRRQLARMEQGARAAKRHQP
jgi:molybdopterin/thiamine biosynthesis adenylyltransferase